MEQRGLFTAVTPKALHAVWVLVNPSTADGDIDDPTVRNGIGFTQRLAGRDDTDRTIARTAEVSPCGTYRYRLYRAGSGWSLAFVNLFAWRSTDADMLLAKGKEGRDVVGPENDRAILQECAQADRIIVAWGAHARFPRSAPPVLRDRAAHVLDLLRGRDLWCPGTASIGEPRHPLMLGYATTLVPFRRAS